MHRIMTSDKIFTQHNSWPHAPYCLLELKQSLQQSLPQSLTCHKLS